MKERRPTLCVTVRRETIEELDELKERLSQRIGAGRVSKSAIVEFLIREAAKKEDLSKILVAK